MALKDLLKKKDKVQAEHEASPPVPVTEEPNPIPEITFLRTTTHTQEVISPPVYPDENRPPPQPPLKRPNPLRRLSNASQKSSASERERPGSHRLSDRLHLGPRSRSASSTSVNIPTDLPEIESGIASNAEEEAEWEMRATLLARGNSIIRPGSSSANRETQIEESGKPGRTVSVSDAKGDDDIQEAIRLHEEGDLPRSTQMFGRLADPRGANNALSQVLYGLALRHGWGCTENEELAATYLSYAASNSAEIESLALGAGSKKGGSAKGELTLAIFELANCFRNGWGVKKDPVAAKQYYETAANLGDVDAMNEVAWCYLEGFGTKKDKVRENTLFALPYKARSVEPYALPILQHFEISRAGEKEPKNDALNCITLHRMNRTCIH